MGLSTDIVLRDAQSLTRPGLKPSPPASAPASDDPKDPLQSPRQNAERVENALDALKRAARLTGVNLNDDDIKIGMNMIIVDDRFRRG
ncbi:hypothetical protein GALL_232890 [mine drainage metagenome]|uniref:Uncharacterized protein n=1 Tax=mine drainage metagenome TaxID=410659 RepID=A0A1J5RRX9_9ZZZZ